MRLPTILTLAIAAMALGLADPATAALRIGVAWLPEAAPAPEARLYTDEGFERDIGREIGKRVGDDVTFVALPPADLAGAVRAGVVDLALARLADGARPPEGVAALDLGYRSGLAASMRTDTTIRTWDDLAGRTVCVAAGNPHARAIAEASGARVQEERAPARSLMQVRTGACDAAIHDAAVLDALFATERWRKFSSTLPTRAASDLVALAPAASPIAAELGAIVADLGAAPAWDARRARWARNVDFEVYLDQDAPDCH